MSQRVVQVTAGVLVRQAAVLVCQRPPGGHHPGKWEFPGGKVEQGESLIDCMRRELHEEIGIAATVGRTLWATRYQYPGRRLIELTFFLIEHYVGRPTNRECAAMQWTSIETLATFDFLDGDREFVRAVQAGRIQLT